MKNKFIDQHTFCDHLRRKPKQISMGCFLRAWAPNVLHTSSSKWAT